MASSQFRLDAEIGRPLLQSAKTFLLQISLRLNVRRLPARIVSPGPTSLRSSDTHSARSSRGWSKILCEITRQTVPRPSPTTITWPV